MKFKKAAQTAEKISVEQLINQLKFKTFTVL